MFHTDQEQEEFLTVVRSADLRQAEVILFTYPAHSGAWLLGNMTYVLVICGPEVLYLTAETSDDSS